MNFGQKLIFHPFILVSLAALADCYAAYTIKLKFNELGSIEIYDLNDFLFYSKNLIKSWLFISGLLSYIAAPVLSFIALNKLDLNSYYPVSIGFHLLFIIFLSGLLGESISLYKITGIVLLVLSLFFLFKG